MARLQTIYEFGDFVLDAAQQRLARRDGRAAPAPVSGKAFDALIYFLEHPQEQLDKDALLAALWPDAVVEENSLTQVVSTLRQLLGETRGDLRYIVTVPRKGYRFVADVRKVDGEPRVETPLAAPSKRRLPWLHGTLALSSVLIVAIAVLLVWRTPRVAEPPAQLTFNTLAILPFKPLVAADRDPSLELGMADSLITQLARSDRQVVPLSSVRRYDALDQDAIAAARELHADGVLDGLIQRQKDRLRVRVRLLRVADGRQVWAENFDQPFTSIFDVQDAIALRVARGLTGSSRDVSARHGTRDPEAYGFYASGRYAFQRLTEPSLEQALDFYRQAIARDSTYAEAYVGLAACNSLLGVQGMRPPNEVFPRAREYAEKALALDPSSAAAYTERGQVRAVYDHDWKGAREDLARARSLDPGYASTYFYLGIVAAAEGNFDLALAELQRAREIEPAVLSRWAAAALVMQYQGKFDESIAELRRLVALDERFDLARGFLVRGLIAKGEYGEALAQLRASGGMLMGSYGYGGQVLALSGQTPAARAELERVLQLSRQQYVPAYDIAMIYSGLRDADNTLLWLSRAVDDHSVLANRMAFEPWLEFLRGDPRFIAIVKRIGPESAIAAAATGA